MVVRFHLHQQMHRLGHAVPMAVRLTQKTRRARALHHRRVVAVGGQHAFGRSGVRHADHVEEAMPRGHLINRELGVEDLMPAVFRVDLREHHQLSIGGVAPGRRIVGVQVIDFLLGKREAPDTIGLRQCWPPLRLQWHMDQWPCLRGIEDLGKPGGVVEQTLRHCIEDLGGRRIRKRTGGQTADPACALDPLHRQTADAGDIAGLAAPWRQGAETRHHEACPRIRRQCLPAERRRIAQQGAETRLFLARDRSGDEIDRTHRQCLWICQGHPHRLQPSRQRFKPEIRQCGGSEETKHDRFQ